MTDLLDEAKNIDSRDTSFFPKRKVVTEEEEQAPKQIRASLVGEIKTLKKTATKKTGQEMAYGILANKWSQTSFVIFPRQYDLTSNKMRLQVGKRVQMDGILSVSNMNPQLVVHFIKDEPVD